MNRLLTSAVLISVCSLAGHAATVTYTSETAFASATTGDTTYTVPPPASGPDQLVDPSYTIGPATFNPGTGDLYLVNDAFYGAGQTYLAVYPSDPETVTLSPGVSGIGFMLSEMDSAGTLGIDLNGTLLTTLTLSGPPTFFGVTSTVPITSLALTGGSTVELDILNFIVEPAAITSTPTPEPSSLLLLGTGALGLLGAVRRRTTA